MYWYTCCCPLFGCACQRKEISWERGWIVVWFICNFLYLIYLIKQRYISVVVSGIKFVMLLLMQGLFLLQKLIPMLILPQSRRKDVLWNRIIQRSTAGTVKLMKRRKRRNRFLLLELMVHAWCIVLARFQKKIVFTMFQNICGQSMDTKF